MPASERAAEFVAVYGSLMRGCVNHARAGMDALDFVAECSIPGRLYDLGEFPGLKLPAGDESRPDGQRVAGELYRATPATLARLDRFEGAVGEDPLYRRRRVDLLDPVRTAWVYEYAQSVADAPVIDSGDWRAHVE
jgi:gamma-glutamylcyclotransferase (GGCT)/AIG2-like uncharacterized protein YtfP